MLATRTRPAPTLGWVVTLCALGAVAMAGYQLAQPWFLTGVHGFSGLGYDDGVYLGAADRFVHGSLPYRDYAFLQPPGLVLLLSPAALLGRLVGTGTEMAAARLLTLAVSVADACLAAYVVRSRGRAAVAFAGLAVAFFPLAADADHSLLLEPYLALFMLAAIALAFDRTGRLSTGRRLLGAYALMGFATDVKVWGLAAGVPLLVIAVRRRRRAACFAYAAGLIVPALPFFLAAPGTFMHDVVVAQTGRADITDALTTAQRLSVMLGFGNESASPAHTTGAVVATCLIGLVVVVGLRRIRTVSDLEWCLLGATALMMAGLCMATQYYAHYSYAVIVLLAPLVAAGVSRLRPTSGVGLRAGRVVAVGLPLAVTAVCVSPAVSRAATILAADEPVNPVIAASILAGRCVVSDDPVLLELSDRWRSAGPCPTIVDPFGLFIATDGRPPPGLRPFPAALTQPWADAFTRADAVVLSIDGSDYVPFDPTVTALLEAGFQQTSTSPHAVIWIRR